jgi:ATP-binding cassette subfamily C (CFTR/MRP) protein 4
MSLPLFIAETLKYFDGTRDKYHALKYAVLISLGITINCIVHHPYFLSASRVGMRINKSLAGLLYKKALRLSNLSNDNQLTGQLINMLSTDCSRVETSIPFMSFIVIAPIELLFVIYLLFKAVHVSILSGLIIMFIAIPSQSLLGKVYDHMRRITSKKCDRRINLINEIFNGIKIIKMYCWENPFKKLIEHLRRKELKYQRNIYFVSTFNQIIDQILPSTITFTSGSVFCLFTNLPLLPSYIVLAMSYYLRISSTMGFFFTNEVILLIGARVSLKRMQDFLLKPENERENKLLHSELAPPFIKCENYTCSFGTNNNSNEFQLKQLRFEVNKNELIGIIGPVGAGKSSVLLGLIEQLNCLSGNVKVNGSVFYVPQEPWIFTATIRQNILFGKEYDEKKFKNVLKASCLDQDVSMFEQGDKTIIGEKGNYFNILLTFMYSIHKSEV